MKSEWLKTTVLEGGNVTLSWEVDGQRYTAELFGELSLAYAANGSISSVRFAGRGIGQDLKKVDDDNPAGVWVIPPLDSVK